MGDVHAKFFDALQSLGIRRNPDAVRPAQTVSEDDLTGSKGSGRNDGAMTAMQSIDASTATRSHAASAYLAPNLGRANLLVLPEAYVTKESAVLRTRVIRKRSSHRNTDLV